MVYGFKDQMEFDEMYMPKVSRWNRVMQRVKDGAKMTEKNLAVIDEINKEGFDVTAIAEKFTSSKIEDEE